MVTSEDILKASNSKCKTCKLDCPLKSELLSKNKKQTCVIPVQKAHAIINKQDAIISIDNEMLDEWSKEYLLFIRNFFINQAEDSEKIKIGNFLFNKINQYKETFQPAPSTNVNIQMDMRAQEIADRVNKYLQDKTPKKIIDVKKKRKKNGKRN